MCQEEKLLIQKIKSSDNEAFKTIFFKYQSVLFNFIYYKTNDYNLSQDVVQETYMRALSHWRRQGKPSIPLAWLKTVARNILISHYRRIKLDSLEELGVEVEGEDLNAEQRGNTAVLYYGLARLRKEQSRLLEAFYFNGKNVRAIAAELGLSERAVEGRLRRARQKLVKHLRRFSLAEQR